MTESVAPSPSNESTALEASYAQALVGRLADIYARRMVAVSFAVDAYAAAVAAERPNPPCVKDIAAAFATIMEGTYVPPEQKAPIALVKK